MQHVGSKFPDQGWNPALAEQSLSHCITREVPLGHISCFCECLVHIYLSVLKEISPECSLEGLMLKLKLQYFGNVMRTDSFEKTLMVGKIEGGRRRV